MTTLTWEKVKNLKGTIEQKIEEQLEKAVNNVDSEEVNESDAEKVAWKRVGVYAPKDYKTVFGLVTNDNKRSFGDLFKRSLASVYISKCLELMNYFGDVLTDENKLFVGSLILRHIQSCSCNAYEISENDPGKDNNVPQSNELGGVIYTSISLSNHSCFPNSARYNVGTACVLRATRTIPSRTEILDNYGYLHNTIPIVDRFTGLQNQYKFECNCEPCSENWALYPHIENAFFIYKMSSTELWNICSMFGNPIY